VRYLAQWLVGVGIFSLAGWSLLLAAVCGHSVVARLLGLRGVLPTRNRTGLEVTRVRRGAIWLGGVLGAYALCVSLSFIGLLHADKLEPTRSVEVVRGLRADRAGIRNGDEVTSIDGEPVRDFEHLRALVMHRPETPARVEILRHGEPKVFEVIPDATGKIGVMSIMHRSARGAGEALGESLLLPARTSVAYLRGLSFMVAGKAKLSGPVGIAKEIGWRAPPDRALMLLTLTNAFTAYLFPVELLLLVAYLWRKD
jgi:membrane-associated protease RseP (regulator of RpoE activity)